MGVIFFIFSHLLNFRNYISINPDMTAGKPEPCIVRYRRRIFRFKGQGLPFNGLDVNPQHIPRLCHRQNRF